MNSPGRVTTPATISPKIMKQICDFLDVIDRPVAEISEPNVKMDLLIAKYGFKPTYVYNRDYNFDALSVWEFKTIFCFEVLEHLQNPLLFMSNVKAMMDSGCSLYLSTPNRPRWMWPEFHFNEMSPERLDKWILKPLGLKVVKRGFIKALFKPTWKDFIGVRPIIRMVYALLWDGSYIYKIQHETNY